LEGLRDWLREHKVSHVAMESTGVFWIPVWNVLEQCETKFALTLINPQHVHALPGHKTDRKDGQSLFPSTLVTDVVSSFKSGIVSHVCFLSS
jgi:hypothetical protein